MPQRSRTSLNAPKMAANARKMLDNTMVHNEGRWCTTQVVHNVGLTIPDRQLAKFCGTLPDTEHLLASWLRYRQLGTLDRLDRN